MFSKSELAIEMIGRESFYILEKTGSAIYKGQCVDTTLALSLLLTYKEKLQDLKEKIDESDLYDSDVFEYAFKTIFHAISRLASLLGNISSEQDELDAVIYHSSISKQDELIRTLIEEFEEEAEAQ